MSLVLLLLQNRCGAFRSHVLQFELIAFVSVSPREHANRMSHTTNDFLGTEDSGFGAASVLEEWAWSMNPRSGTR